jgi:hypothetical protein
MSTSTSGGAGDITHCEWCGAEYPDDAPRPQRTPAHLSPPVEQPPGGAEPVTHCEWCGAEYPVPGDEARDQPRGSRPQGL